MAEKPLTIQTKAIEKHLGCGAVLHVGGEIIAALRPSRVNGVPNCIELVVGDDDIDVERYRYGKTPAAVLAGELERSMPSRAFVTFPTMTRSPRDGWNAAATFFNQLAAICQEQAAASSDELETESVRKARS